MKLKQIISALTFACFLLGGTSCSKLSDFEKQLGELESKVVALEAQISALNQNVASLKYLTEGAVITEINEISNGYELTLSDGRKLTISHGTNGNTPSISINEDGYWVINGVVQTVNAYGQNGVTPKFSVDADGYWVVSYDNGTSYERIKDAAGNPVKAKVEISGGSYVEADSFFSDVKVVDDLLVLTLKDGTVVEVPIVKGFKFVISKDGNLVEGIQKIAYGATVTYDVEQLGVASAAIVACPAGFDVELTETTLSVTASPAESEEEDDENKYITKASASLSKDLAILVVSKKGLSILAKMQLEKTEADSGETPDPSEPEDPTPSEPTNDYERYMDGQDIVVANITINKETYGEATLITNDSENKNIATNGVYFVASEATDVTINGSASQIAVLSLDSAMATIKRTEDKSFYVNASAENDYMIFSNIKYETVMTSGNVFGIGGDGEIETILFNKCKIEVPADMNMLYGAKNIVNFNMTDCDVRLHVSTAAKNLVQTNTENTYQTLVFKNNIFYCTDGDLTNFRLFSNNKATIASLEFRNNTIASVYCSAAYGYLTVKSITKGDVVSNLLYLPNYTTHLDGKYIGILHIADKNDAHLNMPSNLAFYNYDSVPSYRAKVSYYSSNGTIYNKAKADNPIPSPDYTNGVFTQGDNYKSFGAKR